MELLCGPDGELPEKLRNLEPRLIEHVSNEIMDRDPNVRWDDIGNLQYLLFANMQCNFLLIRQHSLFSFCSWVRACQEMCNGDGGVASIAS